METVVLDQDITNLDFLAQVFEGFEESSLYGDYKEALGFSDEEYTAAMSTLIRIVKEAKAARP